MRAYISLFTSLIVLALSLGVKGGSVDSLEHLLQKEIKQGNPEGIANLYLDLMMDTRHQEQHQSSITYGLGGVDVSNANGLDSMTAQFLFGMAFSHSRLNDYQKALELYFELIEFEGEDKESLIKADAYSGISDIYLALGLYGRAFEYQMEALHLQERLENLPGIAKSNYNIGTIFFYQEQYEQSLLYYQTAKKYCDQLGDERLIYSSLGALGSLFAEMGELDKSFEYNSAALQLAKEIGFKSGIAYSLGNLSDNYQKKKEFDKAIASAWRSIELKKDLSDAWGQIGTYIMLSEIYLEVKNYDQALEALDAALELSERLNSKIRKLKIYETYAQVYAAQGEKLKAYEYQKDVLRMKDEVLSEKTVEEMGQAKRRYDLQKKEHEIEILKKENVLLEQSKHIRTLQAYILASVVLVLFIFAGWFFSRLKYQRSINTQIQEKNEILSSKNREIDIKNKQLQQSNEDLQQFAGVASHDLKEPLRMINSYSMLLEKKYMSHLDEMGQEFLHYITDAGSRMQRLLEDLLEYSRAGHQQSPASELSVTEALYDVSANLRHKLDEVKASLVIRNENMPVIIGHRTIMIQLFQNLISNGIKFRKDRDPVVIVDCQEKHDEYVFSVADNGIGISEENKEKIFEMLHRLHTKTEYEGSGIGLATCKRLVGKMGGRIWVESEEGVGSTFFFTVPKQEISVGLQSSSSGNKYQ